MSDIDLDEKTRAALGRLTAGEKECLRRKLQHQTAKEIALDLARRKRQRRAHRRSGLPHGGGASHKLLCSGGKVALHEYRRWASPALAKHGIPAEWKADMNKPIVADPG